MRMGFLLFLLPILGMGCTQALTSPDPSKDEVTVSNIRVPPGDVLTLAQASEDAAYEQALQAGAEIVPVDENRSFVVWWEPENFDPTTDPVLVALHGHASWATKGLIVWSEILEERGYAYLGPQWWFGRSLEWEGYYKPDVIYGLIRDELRSRGIPPGHVIFQGFSMGSANSYAITALDKWEGDQFFAVTIANAGTYEEDFPPNEKIATYADLPYEDTYWILYCAMNDQEHPEWNQCKAYDETKDVIESFGGSVELYIKDAEGDHGGFMMNEENVNRALNIAESFIK